MEKTRKNYVAPRVKSIRFFVEEGYLCSTEGCEDHEMRLQLENYKADYNTENMFGDYPSSSDTSSLL